MPRSSHGMAKILDDLQVISKAAPSGRLALRQLGDDGREIVNALCA